jgi:hypothetical protein
MARLRDRRLSWAEVAKKLRRMPFAARLAMVT